MYAFVKQHDLKDCGVACLSMICETYGMKFKLNKLRQLTKTDNNGTNIYGIVDAANEVGFKCKALSGNLEEMKSCINKGEIKLPLIAHVIIDGAFEHFVVIYKIDNNIITIGDPAKGIVKYKIEDFIKIYTGNIVTFENENIKVINERKHSLRKFFSLVLNQKKLFITVFLISLLVSAIGILGSFVYKIIIDNIINGKTDNKAFVGILNFDKGLNIDLGYICLSMIGLYLLSALIQMIRGYMVAKLSKNIDLPLMLGFYNHLVDLPVSVYDSRKTGEIISRFSDASNIRDAISGAAMTIMLDTLMVVFCGYILFTQSKILFLVVFIIFILYGSIILFFKKPIKSINQEIMENNAKITSFLKESIDGIQTVKAFNYEENVKAETKNKFLDFINNIFKGNIIYTSQDVLIGLVESIGTIIIIWLGTLFVINNLITLGTLITFNSLIIYFLSPIKNLIELQPTIQTAIVAAERLNDLLDLEIENSYKDEDNITVSLKDDIKFEHINFRYGNRELILKDVNINIKKGEKIAIVGESGCGKTTVIKLLMKFYEIESGEIYIGTKNIKDINIPILRNKIAYISQNIFLFSDTIINNLKLGNEDLSKEEIYKVCKLCLADDFIQAMPLKYNTIVEENGANLSEGQKQRIAIARALLKKPDILIMDEATSNLDTISESSIKNTIDNLNSEMTCIIIAHRLSTIKSCNKIFVMEEGKIVESGSHEDLLDKRGLYSKYWLNQ